MIDAVLIVLCLAVAAFGAWETTRARHKQGDRRLS